MKLSRTSNSVGGPLTPRGRTGFAACVLTLALSASLASPARAQEWRIASSQDGIELESRSISGERFDELRVSTTLNAPPDAIAKYLFGQYLDEKNRNIRRSFITRDPELTIWSDVLSTPVTSERCYSMRFERQLRASGEIRVRFASLDYLGESGIPDCTALRSRGEWVMTPTGAGTRLTYASLTDIGGTVPVFLARRSLSAAAVMSVRKVVAGVLGRPVPHGIGD